MATTCMTDPGQISQTPPKTINPLTEPGNAQPADDALIESAKSGDSDAFARLMDRHHRFCLSNAYSILRNRDDAEDEVQNAWLQAWTHLESYEGQGAFRSWLSRIVSNQCLMRLRKSRLMLLTSIDQVMVSESSFRLDLIDQRALPEEMVGDGEVAHVLIKEIRGIPPLLRDVLVMRDLSHQEIGDIAAHLGISVPAAKSRLMRARLVLRGRLTKHHGEKGGGTLLQKSARRRVAYAPAN